MNVSFPFRFDSRGRSGQASDDSHIRQLIEQVLFTAPTERVMRPNFGSGIRELVFSPGSDSLAAAVQSTVQAALQQYLDDRIQVNAVAARYDDGQLTVEVSYTPLLGEDTQTLILSQRL